MIRAALICLASAGCAASATLPEAVGTSRGWICETHRERLADRTRFGEERWFIEFGPVAENGTGTAQILIVGWSQGGFRQSSWTARMSPAGTPRRIEAMRHVAGSYRPELPDVIRLDRQGGMYGDGENYRLSGSCPYRLDGNG